MTYHFRACALALCPPTRELLGRLYGVCPMKQECPPGECGYAATRRIISDGERPAGGEDNG